LKKDIFSQAKKYDYFKISQENQYLLKRLNDRNSFYDIKMWEKDYDKSQKYKKNICVFPSIDFRKTSTNEFKLRNYSNCNKSLYQRIKLLNIDNFDDKGEKIKTSSNENNLFNSVEKNYRNSSNSKIMDAKFDSNNKMILYNKKMFLSELSHCSVTFSIQNKK
jgi:hypothetical protein